jgi:hypothetical protein
LILVVFGGVAFLLPLAVYCLVLAMLNRRWRPTLVSGPWDFAGVLFALSGFLFVGGPCLLTGLNKHWRGLWLMGRLRDVSVRGEDWWHFWVMVWAAYFVLVVAGAAFLLWQRRRTTAVYNIDPPQLDDALQSVLVRLGLPSSRTANRILIYSRKNGPGHLDASDPETADAFVPAEAVRHGAEVSTQDAASEEPVELMLRVDSFPSLRHATLTWQGSEDVTRRQVEIELGKVLTEVRAPDSPVAGWLLTIAACLFSVAFVCLLLLVAYVVLFYTK